MSSHIQTSTIRSRRRGRALAGTAALASGLVIAGAPALSAPADAARHHAVSGAKVVSVAKHKKGAPYSYGADGPHSFDCSGFTKYVYKKAGKRLPHNSAAQYGDVRHISRKQAHRGDLVFFRNGGHVSHVGILAKKNTIIHAPHSGAKVRTEKIWTKNVSFGRA